MKGGSEKILAVILAGGRGRRPGRGEKPLVPLVGKPLLAHVIARVRPQVAALVINANGPPQRYADFGYRIVADAPAHAPLPGVFRGLCAPPGPLASAAPPFP